MQTKTLLALAVVITLSWFLHRLAGLGMPLPWIDECQFVFPAINLAEHNTLFTPEVNPERHVMWMQPGYPVVLAVVFKFMPYSLGLARGISWLCVILLFLGILRLLRGVSPQWIVVIVASVFLLSPTFITSGNSARMDALLLGVVVWGWLLVTSGNVYRGIALLLTSLLIHPNGLYYLVAAAVYLAFAKKWPRNRPTAMEALSLAAVTILIGVYIAYILQHSSDFIGDMQYQLERKASRDLIERFRTDTTMVSLSIAYLLALPITAKFSPRNISIVFFGLLSLGIQFIGLEMWYDIYVSLAAIVLVTVLMGVAADTLAQWNGSQFMRAAVVGTLLVGFFLWLIIRGVIANPKHYPERLSWHGMKMDPRGEYITPIERSHIIQRLNTLTDSLGGIRVSFDPDGDAIAIWRKEDCRFIPFSPKFTATNPDVVVVHESKLLPAWWESDSAKARWGVNQENVSLKAADGDLWYIKILGR